MRSIYVSVVLVILMFVAACGGASKQAGSTTAEVSPSSSSESSQPSTSEQTTIKPSTTTTSSSGTSGGVPVVRTGSRLLTLADAYNADSWEEGSFEVPKVPDPVQAIATTIGCYSDEELEFRFQLQSGSLSVAVAQSMDSKNPSVTLQFTLIADGRTVDVDKIAFDQQAVLTTQLDGVSVVKIVADRTDSAGSCSDTTALITSVETS